MNIYECFICEKEFHQYPSKIKSVNPTCSLKCRNEMYKTTLSGENNPNYGKKWTEENRQKQSTIIKSKINDEFREKCGKANRGKKFSEERIKKMHENRSKESYSRPMKDETKKKIGIKSKLKFTKEYKDKLRSVNEKLGWWFPLEKQNDYKFYKKMSNWTCRMFDIISDTSNKLKNLGIFNSFTNPKGVVRDHIYSRKSGFVNGVFPEILRHPVNCQILTHAENLSKKQSRYIDKDAMTLDNLFEKIFLYSGIWKEHNKCLELIGKYKKGGRYRKEDYIKYYYDRSK